MQLCAVQWIVIAGGQRVQALRQDLLESIPESLRSKTFRWDSPDRMQNGFAVPVGDLGLRPGLADAMDSCQQQVTGRRRAGSRRRPEFLQYLKQSGLLRGEPEGARQSEVAGSGGQGDRRGSVLNQG